MPTKERLIRYTLLCVRNPSISESEFHKHWSTKHPSIVAHWLAENKVLKYTQYHTTSAMRDKVRGTSTGNFAQCKVAEYDGFVELVMRESDFESLGEARQGKYGLEIVEPDERYLLDLEKTQVTIGWEEAYVIDGKVVKEVEEGKANVLEC